MKNAFIITLFFLNAIGKYKEGKAVLMVSQVGNPSLSQSYNRRPR